MEGDGVVLWVAGVDRGLAEVGAGWRVVDAGDGLSMVVGHPRPGEHLAGCVRRAAVVALGLAQAGAAVGLAAGPVGSAADLEFRADLGVDVTTGGLTAERARRAMRCAQAGTVVLAWGSQAYLQGEFASVASGFVRLVNLT